MGRRSVKLGRVESFLLDSGTAMIQMNRFFIGLIVVVLLAMFLALTGQVQLTAKGTVAMLLSPVALFVLVLILRSFYKDFRTIDIEKGKAVLGYLWPCPSVTLDTAKIKGLQVKNVGRSEATWVFWIETDGKTYGSVAKGDSEAADVKAMVKAAARLSQETSADFDCAVSEEGGLKLTGNCRSPAQ